MNEPPGGPGLDRRTAVSPVQSEQVSWWSVHEFVQAVLAKANVGPLPSAGTPAWMAMADGDPRKLLAVAVDGEHHVLRIETAQAAMADASREIASAGDWREISREIRGRNDFYTSRPWLRRAVS